MRRDVIAPAGDRDQPDRPRRNRRRAVAMGICARTGGGDRRATSPRVGASGRHCGTGACFFCIAAPSRRACCAAPASRPTMRVFSPGGIGDAPTPASLMSSLRPHSSAADGAYLVGRMAPSTSVAGQWLFPCGTPDPDDISAAGMLDLAGSVTPRALRRRPVSISRTLKAEPGWTLVRDGGYLGLMKRLTAARNAPTSCARASCTIWQAKRSRNFPRSALCASLADLDAGMPRFLDGVS